MKSRMIEVGIILLVLGCQATSTGPKYELPSDLKETDVAWLREQLGAKVERVDGLAPLRDTMDTGEDEDGESPTVETRHVLALDVEEGARYRLQGRVMEGERWVWIEERKTKKVVAGDRP